MARILRGLIRVIRDIRGSLLFLGRFAISWLGFADVDSMLEAFGAVMGLRFDDVDAETRAGQRLAERLLVRCRPKGDAPARLESVGDPGEAAPTIDSRIPRLHKRGRSVVDIEKNSVVPRVLGAPDNLENVFSKNLYPAIVQQSAVNLHQELT